MNFLNSNFTRFLLSQQTSPLASNNIYQYYIWPNVKILLLYLNFPSEPLRSWSTSPFVLQLETQHCNKSIKIPLCEKLQRFKYHAKSVKKGYSFEALFLLQVVVAKKCTRVTDPFNRRNKSSQRSRNFRRIPDSYWPIGKFHMNIKCSSPGRYVT